jgi:hypothetical protein
MIKWFATIFKVFSRRINSRIFPVLRFLSNLTSPATTTRRDHRRCRQPGTKLYWERERTDSLLLPLHLTAVLLLRLEEVEELAAHLKEDVVFLLPGLDLHLLEVLVLRLPLRSHLLLRGGVVLALRWRGLRFRLRRCLLGGHLLAYPLLRTATAPRQSAHNAEIPLTPNAPTERKIPVSFSM